MIPSTNTAAGVVVVVAIYHGPRLLLLLQALLVCLLPPLLLYPHLHIPKTGVLPLGFTALHAANSSSILHSPLSIILACTPAACVCVLLVVVVVISLSLLPQSLL